MEIKLKKLENNLADIRFVVPYDEFEPEISSSYMKNRGKINIPGFRKGKAPRGMIEKFYGEEVFYEDAINAVLQKGYEQAIEELKLEPVGRPDAKIIESGKNQPLIFEIQVYNKPEVNLKEYKGVEIAKPDDSVSEQELEQELEAVRKRGGRLKTLEDDEAARMDDTAVIDFEGFKDGVAFEGGKGENFRLTLGSGQFIPGFEEQVAGKKTGDEFEINVTFPKEYHSEELAGKDALFKVKIRSVERLELPALDDEFAKDISEFDTLDELKADLRSKLEEKARQRAKTQTENAVIDKIAESMEVDIPECMIENQQEHFIYELRNYVAGMGMNFEQYLQISGMTVEGIKAENRERAVKKVRADLVLDAVSKKESIEASDDEVSAEYARLAGEYNSSEEEMRRRVDSESLRESIVNTKTVDFLVKSAVLK